MRVKESKVVRVIKALDDRELSRLELFLDAEFFVTDKSFLRYFLILKERLVKGEIDSPPDRPKNLPLS